MLSIIAARTPCVDRVVGLEIDDTNVSVARHNARLNGVEEKVTFMRSDSYAPFADEDRRSLESSRGARISSSRIRTRAKTMTDSDTDGRSSSAPGNICAAAAGSS